MLKPKILVIGGSLRYRGYEQELIELVKNTNYEQFLKKLEDIPKDKISNTDLLAGIAMHGAIQENAEVDYLPLKKIFPHTNHIEEDQLNILLEKIKIADGIILVTPVYFGDRSSLANSFFKLITKEKLLKDKNFAIISVGAKRNGGQETTNIYALFEAINMRAVGHGNGPQTCQYGGTAFGGDRKKILSDQIGIQTSLEVGKRAAQVAKILLYGKSDETRPPIKIGIIITSDTFSRKIEKKIKKLISSVTHQETSFEIINLVDYHVDKCIACDTCPCPQKVKEGKEYRCIIENPRDQMKLIKGKWKDIDALMIVGTNIDDPHLIDRYQGFTERTRFVRRNNFEWTNIPLASVIFKEINSSRDRLFGLRVMTSYIRQNTLVLKPIRILEKEGIVLTNPKESMKRFIEQVIMIKRGRKQAGPTNVSYVAGGITGGYDATELDDISDKR